MPLHHNQTWDAEGNLIHEEWVEVELTPEEQARESAITKLMALGLTQQEALALIGVSLDTA
jgi:hypothetical protein